MDSLIHCIDRDLLPHLDLESPDPHNPVVVRQFPSPWKLLGAGNYAAVLCHPDYPDQVVKVYAPGRPGIEEEAEVYRRLGSHPAFSTCAHVGDNFLVLKRLHGITLYDCIHRGLYIPEQVIRDIDQALEYARQQGLHPHDVHGRNVMMANGRGLVVDISDFLHQESCAAWEDLKRAYYKLYVPFFSRWRWPIPYWMLDLIRWSYRSYRQWFVRETELLS